MSFQTVEPDKKFILLTFEQDQSQWKIPARIVAHERAKHLAEHDVECGDSFDFETSYKNEFDYTMSSDYELQDWLQNNMDWKDVKDFAVLVSTARTIDYDAWFTNATVEFEENK